MRINKFFHNIFSVISFFIVSVAASQCFSQSPVADGKTSAFIYMKKLNSVFDFVQQNYVDEVDPKVLYEGAIKGLMNSLNDPYTSYLDSNTIRDLADTTNGKFGGVGLQISKPTENTPEKPAYVEVSTPMEDTPGAKAGIISGDFLTAIDGKNTAEMTMPQVLEKLRGEPGTPVTVSILRGKTLSFDVKLIRALIEVPIVKYSMIDKTGYLRISQFTPYTALRVQDALDSFAQSGYVNLIIDLRDNPGGLITSAVDVADKFIDSGTIVSTKGRAGAEGSVFTASPANTKVKNIPIVVLINRGSASASEILSGALKDNHLAYLVGQRSYGKGSVQQVISLGQNEEIKITMARYYTPSDTNIDKVGIPPDREILYPELTEENEKDYARLIKDNVIESYVDSHKNMGEPEIAAYAEKLKKSYKLDEPLLRRLIRIKVQRGQPQQVFDLDYDIQLKEALNILNKEGKFYSLVRSTKTLKELQKEAENSAAGKSLSEKK